VPSLRKRDVDLARDSCRRPRRRVIRGAVTRP